MTPPIPEAAVEAAREAVHTSQCGCSSRVHGPYTWDWYDEIARATLTAALPLIEAEIRGQVAADCRVEAENVDLEVPNAYREGTRDGYLSAATIAERTQR